MDLATRICSTMGMVALLQALIPPPLRELVDKALQTLWARIFGASDKYAYVDALERRTNGSYNPFYAHVATYLGSLDSALSSHDHLAAHLPDDNAPLAFTLPVNETLADTFAGAPVWWTHTCQEKDKGSASGFHASVDDDQRSLSLKYLKKDRPRVIPAYLQHVSKVAAQIEHINTQRHLYTNNYRGWEEVEFKHPSTFATLALEGDLAERIQADLEAFREAEAYYHKTGRAWKRGYLLYGPPGTGKSSMIAAMSNFLHYDVYDLELTKVMDNSELKSLLMQTTRKAIIVIEDVDCTVDLSDRASAPESESSDKADGGGGGGSASKLTLSGLLNFTDGLWSCCGEERIFVFTTNHKERLDPALLRPGRMDMHILLSYCTFSAFQKMASNYLGLSHHPRFADVEAAMSAPGLQLTPAAIAEVLLSSKNDADVAMRSVLAAIKRARGGEENVDQTPVVDSQMKGNNNNKVITIKKGRRKFSFRRFRGSSVEPQILP